LARDDIVEKLSIHDKFTVDGCSFHGLPIFDDLRAFGLSDEEQMDLWVKEVDRLHKDVTDLKAPLLDMSLFGSSGFSDDQIVQTAKLLQSTIHISQYDHCLTILDNLRNLRHNDATIHRLVTVATLTAEDSSHFLIARYTGSDIVTAQPPEALQSPTLQNSAYPQIINYISSQVARMIYWGVNGEDWHHSMLARLAQLTVKLKLIGQDPERYARHSTDAGRSMEASVRAEKDNAYIAEARKSSVMEVKSAGHSRYATILNDKTHSKRYFKALYWRSTNLLAIFHSILEGMTGPETSCAIGDESYEMSSIVCATYGQPLLSICSSRQRQFVVNTGEETLIRICYFGWQLAREGLDALKQESTTQQEDYIGEVLWEGGSLTATDDSTLDYPKSCGSSSAEATRLPKDLTITNGGEFLASHVLLALTSTFVARRIRRMLALYAAYAEPGKHPVICDTPRYDMKFSVKIRRPNSGLSLRDQDWAPLSHYELPRGQLLFGSRDSVISTASSSYWFSKNPFRSRRNATASQCLEEGLPTIGQGNMVADLENDYRHWKPIMETWEIGGTSVTVRNRKFVLAIIAAWLGATSGSIALVCTFRGKTNGIDISNIMIFIWTVSSFSVLLAKAWYVDNWSWNKFMRCRMPCQGLTELSRATGVPDQVILLHLFRKTSGRTPSTKLYTQGLCRGFFRPSRGGPGTGFLIDCHFRLSTLWACGMVLLKVSGLEGARVVCVGGRSSIEQAGWAYGATSKRLVCNLPSHSGEQDGCRDMDLCFEEDDMIWQKGYGLYTNANARFG
jgi:hypothetical protein